MRTSQEAQVLRCFPAEDLASSVQSTVTKISSCCICTQAKWPRPDRSAEKAPLEGLLCTQRACAASSRRRRFSSLYFISETSKTTAVTKLRTVQDTNARENCQLHLCMCRVCTVSAHPCVCTLVCVRVCCLCHVYACMSCVCACAMCHVCAYKIL